MAQTTMTATGLARRDVLNLLGGGLAVLASSALAAAQPQEARRSGDRARGAHPLTPETLGWNPDAGEYVLPPLPYPHDALEPAIDPTTMEIHHSKHHAGYVRGLNKALSELQAIRSGAGDGGLIKHWERELAFNGGGHVNHALFWLNMAPPERGGGGRPGGMLAEAIDRDFGSFDAFWRHFSAAAETVQGSGWGWLVFDHISRRLLVQQMTEQQNMLMTGVTPLLGVDVWEHAYYLRYQNRRGEYINNWKNVINWPNVERMFEYVVTKA